jgi:hypothetical protein
VVLLRGHFFWPLLVTMQLYTSGLETYGISAIWSSRHRHPASAASRCATIQASCVFRLQRFIHLRGAQTAGGAGGKASRVPKMSKDRNPAAPFRPGGLSTYYPLRDRNSEACATRRSSFRTTGLPERRLECKEKIHRCTAPDRLRAQPAVPETFRRSVPDPLYSSQPTHPIPGPEPTQEVPSRGGLQMTSTESNTSPAQPARAPGVPVRRHPPVQLSLPFAQPPLALPGQRGFAVPKIPPKSVLWQPPGRCTEKGCVFPAAGATGRCRQHQLQWSEPSFYSSRQPTSALMDRGRFGPVRPAGFEDAKTGHAYDRRRLAVERATFLGEQQ